MLSSEQVTELESEPGVPNRVRAAMRLAGLTQVQVAAGVNMTQPQISEISNGNYTKLPLETAQRLAALFGCAVDVLFPFREAAE